MNRRALLGHATTVGTVLTAGCISGLAGPEPNESPTETRTPSSPPRDTGTPSAEDLTSPIGTPTPGPNTTSAPTPTPEAAITIDVGPEGRPRFEPDPFRIDTGETVQWAFRSLGHNVKPESTPDGAEWTGTPGEEFDTFPVGYAYRYTFTVPGRYEYVCVPHVSSGMVGSFAVEG